MAIMPPAPGLFSTMTLWPSFFSMNGWTMRAIASLLPPGGKLTISRIGWSGKALHAGPAATNIPVAAMSVAAIVFV